MPAKKPKPCGQDNRIARRKRTADEAAEHRRRLRDKGVIDKEITPCAEPEYGHLWTMKRLLQLYLEVDLDEHMTLQDRVRNLTAISASIAKVNLQADMERRVIELKARDEQRVQKFQALQARYEQEMKRIGEQTGALPARPPHVLTEGDDKEKNQ